MLKYLSAVLISFFIGMAAAPPIILLIKKLKARQTILCYVSQHKAKQGIPTMGGWIFLLSTSIATLALCGVKQRFALLCVAVMLAYGLIGFLDDLLKVVLKRNLGLRAYQKIISQVVIAFIASWFAYKSQYVGSAVNLPISGTVFEMKWWYVPFSMFVYIALTNAVNLTDGLDGLAGTSSAVYFSFFFVIVLFAFQRASDMGLTFYAEELSSLLVFISALIGGMAAFLWQNVSRAKIFMGDTGSLALGGAATAVAMLSKNPFLIPIVGIMFVLSCISVIVQVLFFKWKKRRLFLMSPLHHHLELKGVSEPKIVAYYAIITFVGGIVALAVM